MSTFAASSASFLVSAIRLCSSLPLAGASVGLSAPCCFVVSCGAEEGSAPTEGVGPAPEVSLEEEGGSEEVVDEGLCAEVTPVLSASCSERIGNVVGVLPGMSGLVDVVFVSVVEGIASVSEVAVGFVDFVAEGVNVGSAEMKCQLEVLVWLGFRRLSALTHPHSPYRMAPQHLYFRSLQIWVLHQSEWYPHLSLGPPKWRERPLR